MTIDHFNDAISFALSLPYKRAERLIGFFRRVAEYQATPTALGADAH
jgi:hypothetical protein